MKDTNGQFTSITSETRLFIEEKLKEMNIKTESALYSEIMEHINYLNSPRLSDLFILFNNPKCAISKESSYSEENALWMVIVALKRFYTIFKRLPYSPSLPLMTISPSLYTELLLLVQEQSSKDKQFIMNYLITIFPKIYDFIDDTLLDMILFHPYLLCFYTNQSEEDNEYYTTDSELTDDNNTEQFISPVRIYCLLKAYSIFESTYHYLFSYQSTKDDENKFIELYKEQLHDFSLLYTETDIKIINEIKRYSNTELNMTSSILGGIISEEIIKVISKTYIPVKGTVVWNGLQSKIETIHTP
ncbi:hypothetical protein WA158_006051 [Blastocystis sp. Blastoise]